VMRMAGLQLAVYLLLASRRLQSTTRCQKRGHMLPWPLHKRRAAAAAANCTLNPHRVASSTHTLPEQKTMRLNSGCGGGSHERSVLLSSMITRLKRTPCGREWRGRRN